MDSTTGIAAPIRSPHERRKQKYFRFKFLAGDDALLPKLSEEHRAALRSEGSYKDRAAALGVAIGTVRSRLHRARARLEELRQERAPAGIADESAISH